ncbi:MAG: stage II sporulation protein R, partial [Oscillospiraceae bacterium]|nr:stage II sporulation protein R [Oscillospiraceae bacterium]
QFSMDGVFMRKMIRIGTFVMAVVLILQFVDLLSDKQTLRNSLVRLHVVASSDSREDQAVKLQVRDAVVAYVEDAMQNVKTVEEAKAWLQDNLPELEQAANDVLRKLGISDTAVATLTQEALPAREYDTFSLPSGVYDSLRITIGEGQGQNWWCVLFPNLCLPAAGESTEEVAVGAGFSEELTETVTRQEGYILRFYILDVLGKIENFLFSK